MRINAKAMPTNDTDYNCYIKAVDIVKPIIWGPYHITLRYYIVNSSFGGSQTHAHIKIFANRSNFKRLGMCRPMASVPVLIKHSYKVNLFLFYSTF